MADDPATVSLGRVIRLLDGALAPLTCVSLRYYAKCSCPDEATCSLRDVMLDVRDAMLAILDDQTLADLAARPGRASIDPRASTRRPSRDCVPEPALSPRRQRRHVRAAGAFYRPTEASSSASPPPRGASAR